MISKTQPQGLTIDGIFGWDGKFWITMTQAFWKVQMHSIPEKY